MTAKRSLIRTLAIAALLIGVIVLGDLIATIEFVYPRFDYRISLFFGLLFFPVVIFYSLFILLRLVQLRLIDVLALLLLALLFVTAVVTSDGLWNYRALWKFRVNKAEYLAFLAADSSPSPKFHLFYWEDRGLFVTDSTSEVIVYDETDEIARDPKSRSQEWITRRSNPKPGEKWLVDPPRTTKCRSMKSLGEHFYYIEDHC